jgi:hypothetical protein
LQYSLLLIKSVNQQNIVFPTDGGQAGVRFLLFFVCRENSLHGNAGSSLADFIIFGLYAFDKGGKMFL